MLLIIDNYDSFTYNLYHYFGELGYKAIVYRNDEITVDRIIELNPKGVVISPGPCGPDKAGISIELVKAIAHHQKIPLLGVCLGHQAIGAAFGAKIINALGEQEAAEKLVEAANALSKEPQAMQLRYLSSLQDIASDKTNTIVFPFPTEFTKMLKISDD